MAVHWHEQWPEIKNKFRFITFYFDLLLLQDLSIRISNSDLGVRVAPPRVPGENPFDPHAWASGREEADEYAIVQNSVANNVCFLPGGTKASNPIELLLSARMRILLDCVTAAFDRVILDSPPALPVHDARSLADLCDGVLFVVRAGETDYEAAKKGSMEFREKNLLGVVLNQDEKSEGQGGYYYGHSEGK